MLRRTSGGSFCSGSMPYWESADDGALPEAFQRDQSLKIYIPVYLPDLGERHMALVDTGAPYVTFGQDLVEELKPKLDPLQGVTLLTRHGRRVGQLCRITLQLVPNEGESLTIDSLAFLCDWPDSGSIILGYQGFLNRLQFAIDPTQRRFYFGDLEHSL